MEQVRDCLPECYCPAIRRAGALIDPAPGTRPIPATAWDRDCTQADREGLKARLIQQPASESLAVTSGPGRVAPRERSFVRSPVYRNGPWLTTGRRRGPGPATAARLQSAPRSSLVVLRAPVQIRPIPLLQAKLGLSCRRTYLGPNSKQIEEISGGDDPCQGVGQCRSVQYLAVELGSHTLKTAMSSPQVQPRMRTIDGALL